jgi:hypothetical protein
MQISRRLAQTALSCAACIFLDSAALAFDLTGAWATDAAACDKVFSRKGKSISFRPDSDMFGSGLIIDGKRIRGRMASCTIKTSREDGAITHMLAGCATDIMLQTVQFSVKVIDDNRIVRIFPGIDGMELIYHRCPTGPAPSR